MDGSRADEMIEAMNVSLRDQRALPESRTPHVIEWLDSYFRAKTMLVKFALVRPTDHFGAEYVVSPTK